MADVAPGDACRCAGEVAAGDEFDCGCHCGGLGEQQGNEDQDLHGAGQTVPVWIDRHGRYQDLADPSARAQCDGLIAALLLWAILIGVMAATVSVWRRATAPGVTSMPP
ncbi:hypothetical protein JYB55_05860 [Mycolicibacterium septicum]|nr:hypothetical protein [Mycolicibacterium septicum]